MPIDEVADELIALLVLVEVDEVEVDEDVLMVELVRLDSDVMGELDVIHIDDDDEVEVPFLDAILQVMLVDEMVVGENKLTFLERVFLMLDDEVVELLGAVQAQLSDEVVMVRDEMVELVDIDDATLLLTEADEEVVDDEHQIIVDERDVSELFI